MLGNNFSKDFFDFVKGVKKILGKSSGNNNIVLTILYKQLIS